MRKAVAGYLAIIWLAFSTLSCANLRGKERGVIVGATAGAAAGASVGAVIGHDSHDSGEGAGIGAVFGAILGGILGGLLAQGESPPPPVPPVEKKEVPLPSSPPEVKEEAPPPAPPSPVPPSTPPAEEKEVPPPPPAPPVAEKESPLKRVVLSDVLFNFGKYNLKPTAYPILKEVVEHLKANPSIKLSVEGHTDSIGSQQYNQGLSLRRVHSVKKYLVSQGIGEERLNVKGFGETRPVASNKTRESRRLNRRVEFKVSP